MDTKYYKLQIKMNLNKTISNHLFIIYIVGCFATTDIRVQRKKMGSLRYTFDNADDVDGWSIFNKMEILAKKQLGYS